MTLKLFRATVANADTGSLKSLHTLFDKYLDHMLVKFEQNRMVRTIRNFELFGKKTKQNKPKQKLFSYKFSSGGKSKCYLRIHIGLKLEIRKKILQW